ncbi:E3 ubiquitin-protein ligase TRIM71 [Stylophora pistillata]|uniref:E3 ubiquitin-protein ligase TRIM71 n=1 Tax=Stylophora pistillata TaxID=50429 RepID=A0A2B4RT55_STYPI|nr:E3 ubiquitin-protein ligase TRIM71 [Stylophora pistillata]
METGNQEGQFQNPADVIFVNDDGILVAEECNHRIQQLNVQTGNFVKRFGKQGSGDRQLKNPASVCIKSDGEFIVVVEYGNSRIQVFTMDGEPVLKFGDIGPERLNHPIACVCYEDKFIVTDLKNNCVKVFDSKGQFSHKFGEKGNGDGQLEMPTGLCIDNYGNLLLCDVVRIQQFTLEGTFTGKTSTVPWSVATMPDDRILVTGFNERGVKTLR